MSVTSDERVLYGEEVPLLPKKNRKKVPLPVKQLTVLLILQLSEPITATVVYPFVPQLVLELGVTNGDETKVGYYAGLIESLFFVTEFMFVLQWGRLSDRIGRRPVLLTGLVGLTLSMIGFGLSKTFLGLVLSRMLCGALNGNIGVIKSMMGEISAPSNMAQTFAFLPIVWSAGATVGPLFGGFFSHPYERFPSVFGNWIFSRDYPYFLPCFIAACCSILSFIIAYIFLEESLPSAKVKRALRDKPNLHGPGEHSQEFPDDSGASTPTVVAENPPFAEQPPPPLSDILTTRVLMSVLNYAMLALTEIAIIALLPVFLATSIEKGGLGLVPSTIGVVFSIFGAFNGLFQATFFSTIHDRFGPKHVFIFSLSCYLTMIPLFPIMNSLAWRIGEVNLVVWSVLAFQLVLCTLGCMGFGCIFIYVTSSSPTPVSLGATNGLAQTSASFMRAVGPASASSLFALSIHKNHLGGCLVYVVLAFVTCVAVGCALLLPEKPWFVDQDETD